MIVIIDYKMGNIGSIVNILKRLGYEGKVSSDPAQIKKASKIILPGVGAFDNGMVNLERFNLLNILNQKVLEDKTPILGICIGMQLMANSSEEGTQKGLGWFDAHVKKFKFEHLDSNLRIPCVGWNRVHSTSENNILLGHDVNKFYFVHSYHFECQEKSDVSGVAYYGYEYPVAIHKDNIFGVQFHPEKSHKFGLNLFRRFIEIT